MGETTAVAHGGDHGSRSWGRPPRPRCLPKTALPPQDRAASLPQMFEYHVSFQSPETWTNRHTMLAVAHLMIVAKSFGVDTCPMEGFVSAQVKEAFNIPAEVDVCCLLPMGYAGEPCLDAVAHGGNPQDRAASL
ncbi:nitroreductase family protein [Moorena sp. SIO4G3]|uniref:nitroreductase family protein n=1 Tax=Moorena sp. SIO4G3 TaxID=2607821 RepID=UPI0034175DF9